MEELMEAYFAIEKVTRTKSDSGVKDAHLQEMLSLIKRCVDEAIERGKSRPRFRRHN